MDWGCVCVGMGVRSAGTAPLSSAQRSAAQLPLHTGLGGTVHAEYIHTDMRATCPCSSLWDGQHLSISLSPHCTPARTLDRPEAYPEVCLRSCPYLHTYLGMKRLRSLPLLPQLLRCSYGVRAHLNITPPQKQIAKTNPSSRSFAPPPPHQTNSCLEMTSQHIT